MKLLDRTRARRQLRVYAPLAPGAREGDRVQVTVRLSGSRDLPLVIVTR